MTPVTPALAERLGRLARAVPTPFYAYDADVIRQQVAALRQTFPPETRLLYALKANPSPLILEVLAPLVDGFDVASPGELAAARAAAQPGHALGITGPAKSDALIAEAPADAWFALESTEELAAIERLRPEPTRVLFRVAPEHVPRGFAVEMTGGATPFGFDEETLPDVVAQLRATRARLDGVHVHAGSQLRSWRALADGFAETLRIAERAEALAGHPLERVDLGGGFGARQTAAERPLDLARLGEALTEQLRVHGERVGHAVTPVIEPGRFLVHEAGWYVTRVVRTKTSRGRHLVIVDGGIHHLLLASSWLGPRDRPRPEVFALDGEGPLRPTTVTGALCTPLDTLAEDVPLPELPPGALLVLGPAGAYGLTLSPIGFLSHPLPGEYVLP